MDDYVRRQVSVETIVLLDLKVLLDSRGREARSCRMAQTGKSNTSSSSCLMHLVNPPSLKRKR